MDITSDEVDVIFNDQFEARNRLLPNIMHALKKTIGSVTETDDGIIESEGLIGLFYTQFLTEKSDDGKYKISKLVRAHYPNFNFYTKHGNMLPPQIQIRRENDQGGALQVSIVILPSREQTDVRLAPFEIDFREFLMLMITNTLMEDYGATIDVDRVADRLTQIIKLGETPSVEGSTLLTHLKADEMSDEIPADASLDEVEGDLRNSMTLSIRAADDVKDSKALKIAQLFSQMAVKKDMTVIAKHGTGISLASAYGALNRSGRVIMPYLKDVDQSFKRDFIERNISANSGSFISMPDENELKKFVDKNSMIQVGISNKNENGMNGLSIVFYVEGVETERYTHGLKRSDELKINRDIFESIVQRIKADIVVSFTLSLFKK